MPALLTTKAIVAAIRARLLTFAPIGGGATLNTRLAGRLYTRRVPRNAAKPYQVLRVRPRASDMVHAGEREAFEIELHTIDAPASDREWDAEELADVADEAMLRWKDAGNGGAIACVGRTRQTLPPTPAEAPSEVEDVHILQTFELRAWPQLFSQYHNVA